MGLGAIMCFPMYKIFYRHTEHGSFTVQKMRHPPGHPVTSAVNRTAIKETPCIKCGEFLE
jgi:hypothetical protein